MNLSYVNGCFPNRIDNGILKKKVIPFFALTLNIERFVKVLIIFKSRNLMCSTLSNDPVVLWHMAFALLNEAPVLGILNRYKLKE